MGSDIFVNRDGSIEVYFVEIDERKLEKVQTAIDEWNERNRKINNLDENEECKKIKIIFKRKDEDGNFSFYNPIESTYSLHPLSDLCSFIMFDCNPFDLSEHLKCLLEWNTKNLEEMRFVREILSTMNFQKLDKKCIDANNKKTRLGFPLLNRKIDDVIINTGFFDSSYYAQSEREEYSKKGNVRKKVLSSLPRAHYFE